MCVILLVLKKENSEKLNEIIKNNVVDYANYNTDGISVLATKRNDKNALFYRELDYDVSKIRDAIDNYDFLNIHLRVATKGEKSVDNCHLWQKGNWIFSHNGTIHDLGNEKRCDSLDFFESLFAKGFISKKQNKNKINYEGIQKYMRDSQYTGRSVLYNTALNFTYLFGDFKTFALDKNYLAICSADIETNNFFNLFNLRFESEVENDIKKIETELNGVHLINYNTEKLYQLADVLDYYDGYGGLRRSKESGRILVFDGEGGKETLDNADDPLDPLVGKRFSEMTDDEIEMYYQKEVSRK